MRKSPSSPDIAVDVPWTLNWLWFCSPTHDGSKFRPEIHDRRGATRPAVQEQWREWFAWSKQLWRETSNAAGARHRNGEPVGCDYPDFVSLDDAPQLVGSLRTRWPHFLHWWNTGAKADMVELVMRDDVISVVTEARPGLPEWNRLTIHVIGLRQAQTLGEARIDTTHHAAVSEGMLRDPERFRLWLVRTVETIAQR